MAVQHIVAISVGAVFIIVGAVAFVVIGNAQRDGLRDALTMDGPNDELYASFTNPYHADARPFYTTYNVFNLTNLAAVKAGTEKPNFATVGPFRYRTYVSRENVSFSADGKTMTWLAERWVYNYVPSTQFPTDTTPITNFNGFYAVAVYGVQAQGGESALGVSFLAGVLGTLLSLNATEKWGADTTYCFVSFCGFAQYTGGNATLTYSQSTQILTTFANATLLGTYLAVGAGLASNQATTAASLNTYFPNFGINHSSPVGLYITSYMLQYLAARIPIARAMTAASIGATDGLLFRTISAHDVIFGPDPFLYLATKQSAGFTTNNTVYGTTTIQTGKAGEQYMNCDYYNQVWGKAWTNAYGPNISTEGRSSSTAPFQRDLPERFTVYVGDIQRVVPLLIGPLTSVYDIDTTRYSISFADIFTVDPTWGNTVPGFLAVGAALGGLPVFMGLVNYGPTDAPVAYRVPQYLRDAVTGIDATQVVTSFLDIEALTGLPLNLAKSVQINMLLNLTGFQDAPNLRAESKTMMLPVLWSTQSSIITEKQGSLLYQGIVVVRNLRIAIIVVLVGLGTLMVVLGVAFLSASMVDKGDKYGENNAKVHPTTTSPGTEELK